MKIFSSHLEDSNKIILDCIDINSFEIEKIKLVNKNIINIIYYTILGDRIEIFLKENISIKFHTFVHFEDEIIKVNYNNYFDSESFKEKYSYTGPLGYKFEEKCSNFYIYSPLASSCSLLLYSSEDNFLESLPLVEENGVYKIKIDKDLNGFYYKYKLEVYNESFEVYDPYSKALSLSGDMGYIFNEEDTKVDKCFIDPLDKKESIIYELNIRDISIDENNGIKQKGKFLGLCEEETEINKIKTGLAHLKELGINTIQLMPLFHLPKEKIDEIKVSEKYNWGYDIDSFFALNGVYSNNPKDITSRIIELKKLVSFLHKEGFYVTLDVVYNHTYYAPTSIYKKIFPSYYFREDDYGVLENGSGCSCDMATERSMVRRLVLDSLEYFLLEFDFDGFRFDLMGLHDIDTMNIISEDLKKLKKDVFLYGEGWDIPTSVSRENRPIQENASKLIEYSFFNDLVRDSIKGSVFSSLDRGFVNGKSDQEHFIRVAIGGTVKYNDYIFGNYISPLQSINYFAVHDNHTLWDKLSISNREDSIEDRKKMTKLSFAIILLSQGIPLIHSGEEFCRTKGGVFDSYNSKDDINKIDYSRKKEFMDVFLYVKGLISLRKSQECFKLESTDDVKKFLQFITTPKGSVGFTLNDKLFVLLNSNKYSIDLSIPYGTYNILADKDRAGKDTIYSFSSDNVFVPGISCLVFYRE